MTLVLVILGTALLAVSIHHGHVNDDRLFYAGLGAFLLALVSHYIDGRYTDEPED